MIFWIEDVEVSEGVFLVLEKTHARNEGYALAQSAAGAGACLILLSIIISIIAIALTTTTALGV